MALEEQDKLVEVMLRESRKEKTEYKIVALESTGTVLKEMKLDRFKAIYEIVGGYLPQSEKNEEEETEKDEDDAEGGARKLVCVGLSWPENKDMAETFLPTVLDQLETLATNTTRKNQLALIKCLGNILKVWTVSEEQYSMLVFTKLAAVISSLLQIPKYVQLRTETLQVLGQTVKLLTGAAKPQLVETFRSEVLSSLDGVIKDLGSDPATKTTARDLKTALKSLQGGDEN